MVEEDDDDDDNEEEVFSHEENLIDTYFQRSATRKMEGVEEEEWGRRKGKIGGMESEEKENEDEKMKRREGSG